MTNRTPIYQPRILVLEGLWSDTSDAIRAAGGIPTEEHPWSYIGVEEALLSGEYDGLLLTGGSDINPNIYGEKPHPEVYGIDNLRDEVELRALSLARMLAMPVMGICRGSQIMAASRGGRLTQHIDGHRGSKHWVECTPEGRTFRRACSSRDIPVISLHHQCIADPGKEMHIAARALDGTPEAIESDDGLWLGVQFHPELNAFENPRSFAIFRWLVQKAAEYAGGTAPRRSFRGAARRRKEGTVTDFRGRDGRDDASPSGATAKQRAFAFGTGESKYDVEGEAVEVSQAHPRKPRRAGDPAIPSMREAVVEVIEESRRAPRALLPAPSLVCRHCGMLFDNTDDHDDHEWFVHDRHRGDDYDSPPFYAAADRYPELEPPPGHPAWDPEADIREANRILHNLGANASEEDIAYAWMESRGFKLH